MGIKKYKPTTPSRRQMTIMAFDEITKNKPEKQLTVPLKKSGGRNVRGKMTVRHHGGGHKRLYRIIDFKRLKDNVPARVAAIEYDPNRSANIALLHYADGHKAYIIAPNNLKVGDIVESGPESDIKVGNSLPLKDIPVGALIHNIELRPGKGAVSPLCRSRSQLMARKFLCSCSSSFRRSSPGSSELSASIGQVGNVEHESQTLSKAGRNRWLGIRPTVRGSAMTRSIILMAVVREGHRLEENIRSLLG